MQRAALEKMLRKAGLKPTAKRLAIAGLLFDGPNKHVTAEDLMEIARRNRVRVSQATIYNSLNQFCAAGLLKRIAMDGTSTFFDTNIGDHHHIFHEDDGRLIDLPTLPVEIGELPELEAGESIRSVDIVIRVGRD